MLDPHVICNRADLDAVQFSLGRVFRSTKGLPDFVFNSSIVRWSFLEFEELLDSRFWPELSDLAAAHGDRFVFAYMQEPSADEYYVDAKCFGALSFSTEMDRSTEVSLAMSFSPHGDVANEFRHVCNTLIWVGESGTWGAWGERELGLAVYGTSAQKLPQRGWTDAMKALDHMSLAFRNRLVPTNFATTFIENYCA